MDDWAALELWQDDAYLLNRMGGSDITVNYTPSGEGDCVTRMQGTAEEVFVFPHEERVPFEQFWEDLQGTPGATYFSPNQGSGETRGVPYASIQNDSFRMEFQALAQDVPSSSSSSPSSPSVFSFFEECFGGSAEAINLWLGDGRSTSACHQDFFENVYCVVRGEKHFTLCPPTDIAFLYEQEYPKARFVPKEEQFDPDTGRVTQRILTIQRHDEGEGEGGEEGEEGGGNDTKVRWVPVDPLYPNLQRFPAAARLSPVEVSVCAGEVLYLPATWFHRVAQHGVVVAAVNAWFDMAHGPAFVCSTLARNIALNK